MKILIIILTLTFRAYCPEYRCLYIEEPAKIQPYEAIWQAIIQIESSGNPQAYHMEKDGFPSIGIAQIRQCRLNDYNKKTGQHLKLSEMYDPEKAKTVFLYYASQINDPDQIIRQWNGSGKQTYIYLKRVKNLL